MKKMYQFFLRKLPLFYSITVILIGMVFCFFIAIYFLQNYFRLWILIQKYATEFIFLILTGHFLYSLRYEIMGMSISFHAFVIYISNSILKEHYNKGIELVYFFIFIYFTTQFILNLFSNQRLLLSIETVVMRIMMWSILIYAYNFLAHHFQLVTTNLRVQDILIVPVLIVSHLAIKAAFMTTERFIQQKYYHFVQHTLPYLIIDSIFIYFSIIVGSVYNKNQLFNTALFITFLAVIVSLANFITKKEHENYLYYSIHAFFNPQNIYRKNIFPFLPIYRKLSFNKVFNEKIRYLTFIAFYQKNFFINDLELQDQHQLRLFIVNQQFICTIQALENEKGISSFKERIEKIYATRFNCSFCLIDRNNWQKINTNYLFKILFYKLKKNKKNREIIKIDQNYVFS